MTTYDEIPWLDPDGEAVAAAFRRGEHVQLRCYGDVIGSTKLDCIYKKPYRVISPAPRTYTLAEAQVAYCDGRWICWASEQPRQWYNILSKPINMRMIASDWLVSDADPREKPKPVPREVDVHEAYETWAKGGLVRGPDNKTRCHNKRITDYVCFIVGNGDIGKPWTVEEEPPS